MMPTSCTPSSIDGNRSYTKGPIAPVRQKGHREGQPLVPSTRNMPENSVCSVMMADVGEVSALVTLDPGAKRSRFETGNRAVLPVRDREMPGIVNPIGLTQFVDQFGPSFFAMREIAVDKGRDSRFTSPMTKRSKSPARGSGFAMTQMPPPTTRGSPSFLSRARGPR